jgi:hypothetical protein
VTNRAGGWSSLRVMAREGEKRTSRRSVLVCGGTVV